MALVAKLAAQTDTSTALQTQIGDLTTQIAAQTERATREQIARDAAERTLGLLASERDRLKGEIAKLSGEIETAKAERGLMEGQVAKAREDREAMQKELQAVRQEAEAAWASERVDAAVLRERINDVSVEVARVVAILEGPGGKLETLVAAEPGRGVDAEGKPVVLSLGDRIRAIQGQANQLRAVERAGPGV